MCIMKLSSRTLFSSVLLLCMVEYVFGYGLAGPYELQYKGMEHCPDEGTGELKYHTKLNKCDKYRYCYNGEFIVPYDIDETVSMEALAAKRLSSGWGLNAYNYTVNNICEDVKQKGPIIFKDATGYMGVNNECPIPAGNYTAKNWIIRFPDSPVEMLPYGEYRVDIILKKNGKTFGCIRLYLDIVPIVPKFG